MNNRQYMESLRRWECRDSTYQDAEPALVFAKAQGSTIWDAEGRAYIDFCAGFGVAALGHNNPIQKAVFASCFENGDIIHGIRQFDGGTII